MTPEAHDEAGVLLGFKKKSINYRRGKIENGRGGGGEGLPQRKRGGGGGGPPQGERVT